MCAIHVQLLDKEIKRQQVLEGELSQARAELENFKTQVFELEQRYKDAYRAFEGEKEVQF